MYIIFKVYYDYIINNTTTAVTGDGTLTSLTVYGRRSILLYTYICRVCRSQVNNYHHSPGYLFFFCCCAIFIFHPLDTNQISPYVIAVAAAGRKETIFSGPFRRKSDSKSPYRRMRINGG